MISVSPTTLVKIIDRTPCHQSILIAGDHGIGKTSIIQQVAKKHDRKLIEIFLGQMNDRGDLVGPSVRIGEKKFGFLDPSWWPEEGENVYVLLDELNRAEQELHSPIFDFVLNGRLMGRVLPGWNEEDGSRIFAAVNSGDDYFVTEMDPALLDRFNLYRLTITASDWLGWAREAQLNRHVVTFIDKHDNLLWVKSEGLDRGATPRAWHRASDWLNKNNDLSFSNDRLFLGIALEGIVGGVSAEFVKFCISNGITASDILNIPSAKENPELHKNQWDDLIFNLSTMTTPDLISINAQCVSATVGMDRTKTELYCENLYIYLKWLVEKGFKEVATDLHGAIRDSNHAKQVYYCSIDLTCFFTEVLDNLNC
jgi:hypothetical protein